VFSVGSLVTAGSYDLVTMVVGRFLQGVGGGGLVPATLALVADIWTADRRGLPLGVIGAVQELGSVLGPLYGAVVLSQASWHAIFWINLVVGLVLAAALVVIARRRAGPSLPPSAEGVPDWLGVVLGTAAVVALGLVLTEPERLTSGVTSGLAFVPYVGESRWTTPMAIACYVLGAAFVARELTATRPLVRLRGLHELGGSADLSGAVLLGLSLAGIVLAFATADPEVQVFSPAGPWYLLGSALFAALFWWRQRVAARPLVPLGSMRARPAWGSLVVSFLVGSALIAALVDIPVFARVTTYEDSQLGAALVLVRLLAALPLGALLGGYLLRHTSPPLLAAAGMMLAAVGFVWMAQWDRTTLDDWSATIPLVVCGLGFGLAIAPVNAALLAATRADVHGIASALLVVARMVGMLVGISALTAIGLRRFYAVSEDVPPVGDVCDSNRVCDAYLDLLKDVGVEQTQAIFWGAAVCAFAAAVASLVVLRSVDTGRTG
jgi:MFS family permease